MRPNPSYSLTLPKSILLVVSYFFVMLLYTAIDVIIWKKLNINVATWLNIVTIIICITTYFYLCFCKINYAVHIFPKNAVSYLVSILAIFGLYLILDGFLDPFFENLFPMSEIEYQKTLQTLRKTPISSFLTVCIIAPIAEELLMRGIVLGGLKPKYGILVALIVSSIVFALLHFNMVQTLSALVSGMALGLIYLKTNSLFCCILTHAGYNALSYFVMIF